MAPSGGGKGGRGGGPAPQAAYQQAYQDFSYEDDGPAPPNFGVGSGFGGRFAGLGYLEVNAICPRKSHLWTVGQCLHHKVRTYVEYRAVSGVFQNIDPPPPSPPSECVHPPHQRL
jgi:hypothetical protein